MKCCDCSGEAENGQRRCGAHASAHRQRERDRLKRKRRCHNCKAPSLRGQTRCAAHAAANRDATRRLRGKLLGGLGTDE